MLEGLVCREARPDDVADLLTVRNAIFPPLTPEQYLSDPHMTCVLARLHGEAVGAIPLSQRRFQLAPGVFVDTAFENAVGTREDLRNRGVGSAMIRAAGEFLTGRADELMVYRGGERTVGYRFYMRSGHRDVHYLRPMVLAEPGRHEVDVRHGSAEDALAEQPALLRCFAASYGHCGGFPVRHADYWREALGSTIYLVIPHEVHYFAYPAAGEAQAYVLAGVRMGGQRPEQLTILEFASAAGEEGARRVLLGAADYAATRGLRVWMAGCADHPHRGLLRALGFQEHPRWMQAMAQPLDPAALAAKVCRAPEALRDLRVRYWAPFGDGVLWEGDSAADEVTVEGTDDLIYRLLNLRLDVVSAYRHDLLTIINGSADVAQRLGAAFPYTPWVYHHIDYI